jgi:hypothetical protein
MKKIKIKDAFPLGTTLEQRMLIQGSVPKRIGMRVKKALKHGPLKKNWNDFILASCISFLSDIKGDK